MKRIKLFLLAVPLLLASMLFVASPAYATKVKQLPPVNTVNTVAPLFAVVFEQPNAQTPVLAFTNAPNAAIDKFGCGCTSCLNAARLQGRLPLQ